MTITVFGASGRVGRLVVNLLLEGNYNVIAFVHSSGYDVSHPNLTVLRGDVHSVKEVTAALQGSQAVISTLGSWGTPTKDIVSSAMRSIIPAMQQAGISRIITLTGTAARATADKPPLMDKILHKIFSWIAPKIQTDGEMHLRLLEQSDLTWTTLRSPAMRGSGRFGNPRLVMHPPGPFASTHRKDVATAIVGQLNDTSFISKAPYILS